MNKTPKLPFTRFSTAQLDPSDRWDAWRDSISVIFDVSPLAEPAPAQAHQSVSAAHLGTVLFGEIEFTPQSYDRSQRRVIRDGIDHYLVQLYIKGGFAGLVGTEEVTLRAGDISILDLAQTLQTKNPSSHAYSLVIPRDTLDTILPVSGVLHGQILRRESAAARLLSEHLRTLSQALPDTAAREAPMLAEAAISMVAACFRPTAETRERAGASMAAATLDTIKRHIETRLDKPNLTPASIATAFRLSRSSLYRLFEPLGGVSAYIQERRLARAHTALLQPANRSRRIHEIAFDCGFSSEAHFSRSFRSAYGIAPSALHKEAGNAARLSWNLEEEYNYARWIAQFRPERKRTFL